MTQLKGKTALITGVSRKIGIGFAIAKKLGEMGASLYLQGFSEYDRQLSLSKKALSAEVIIKNLNSSQAEYVETDFSKADAPAKLMKKAVARFGHVDILVLNHTYDSTKTLPELTAEEIDKHLSVNVRAALLLVQAYQNQHDGRPGGRIVLLTSGQHLGPMPHMAYVATKGALHQLTASLSDHFIDAGITVNTVNPGPTRTYTPDPETDKAVSAKMPLGRWGFPEDAARLIGWLVSEDAKWITGQIINSEGGFRR